jgi:hypothetical protein
MVIKLKGTASSIDNQPTVASQLPVPNKRVNTPPATTKHTRICIASQHNVVKNYAQLHYLQRKELSTIDRAT